MEPPLCRAAVNPAQSVGVEGQPDSQIATHDVFETLSMPLCTQLAFSGGTGSGCIAEMVLNGDIPRPDNFVVIRANPGMENSETNSYVEMMADRFKSAGIPYLETKTDLLRGLLELKQSGKTRFDMPPFWTKNRETGKKGRLMQQCTQWAKIAPMDAALRQWMHDNLGISRKSRRIGVGTVEKWIGFSQDEWMRIKENKRKYITMAYPLVDRRMTKADISRYYLEHGLKLPPRSVCNACYANDVAHFKRMHDERPDEFWGQAVPVDEAIRDLRYIGIRDECFVSSSLLPLRELAALGFSSKDELDAKCHSGHCFV